MAEHLSKLHIFLALCGVALLLMFVQPPHAESQGAAAPITGYAWSDTIGWVSLDGLGYGLSIADDATISGYAWSDNVGWISAQPADLTDCPATPCTAEISGGGFSGWLRALSGATADSGGWDGFISLSGPGYGVTRSGAEFSGYAWGDINVGWLDFSFAQTSCTPSYSCTGPDNQTITHLNASCQTSTITTCAAPAFCSAGSAICLNAGITGDIAASPRLVPSGKTIAISWTTTDAASCTVTGSNGDAWNGLNGAETSSPITQVTHYTLTCDDADPDETEDDFTDRITVVRVPSWLEI